MRNFNHRIEIFSEGSISDGAGGTSVHRRVLLSTFADIKQVKMGRKLEDAQLKLPTAYRVKIHFRDYIPEVGHRVKWRCKSYNIISTPELVEINPKEVEFTMQ